MLSIFTPGTGGSIQVRGSSFIEMRDAEGVLCGIVWLEEYTRAVHVASAGEKAFEAYRKIFKRQNLEHAD